MNSIDSMGSFESAVSLSTDAEEQEPPSSFNAVYAQTRLETPPAVLPFERKAVVCPPVTSRFSPWLINLVYFLGRWLVIPAYFGRITISGQENLPRAGSMILAPTHRSRWDAFLVAFAAGHHVTGRHLRYMVTADEVVGFQGWFIRRLGGFPVDTCRPAIATLRHGVDLLLRRDPLVIFPEGNIFRHDSVQPLKPGLARIAMQAEVSQPDLNVRIVPISLHYSSAHVPWRCRVEVCIGVPLEVNHYCHSFSKKNAQRLTTDLYESLSRLGSKRYSN